MGFFLETLLGGLMTGMLYALVALGFVLIFKASGVFNFAQGAMVLFAALAMARFSEWIPRWLGMEQGVISVLLSIVVSIVIMIGVAYAVERLALRHLVNQEPITLLMATLGIAYLLDGLGPMIFGSAVGGGGEDGAVNHGEDARGKLTIAREARFLHHLLQIQRVHCRPIGLIIVERIPIADERGRAAADGPCPGGAPPRSPTLRP